MKFEIFFRKNGRDLLLCKFFSYIHDLESFCNCFMIFVEPSQWGKYFIFYFEEQLFVYIIIYFLVSELFRRLYLFVISEVIFALYLLNRLKMFYCFTKVIFNFIIIIWSGLWKPTARHYYVFSLLGFFNRIY